MGVPVDVVGGVVGGVTGGVVGGVTGGVVGGVTGVVTTLLTVILYVVLTHAVFKDLTDTVYVPLGTFDGTGKVTELPLLESPGII